MGNIGRILLSAFITTVIISIFFAIAGYTPTAQQEPHTLYFSFTSIFIFSFFAVAFALIPGSFIGVFLTDILFKKVKLPKRYTYLCKILMFIVGGFGVGYVYLVIATKGDIDSSGLILPYYFAISIIGSVLFLHLYMFVSKLFRRFYKKASRVLE